MSTKFESKSFCGNVAFEKKSYTVPEVMRILDTTRQSVYKLIKNGCFRAVKVEKGYRIVKKSFDDWLNGTEGVV